eukprot:GHVU01236115.1.p1 GENE.GHVU01236115.1~~GHVU01236115.1.p1  ORF type:complete len:158 (-),score=7.33 GHVU01236115.1:38-511(-)
MDVHLSVLTKIVHTSLSCGAVLKSSKKAVITLLLKKSTLTPSVKNYYRPMSNLTVLGKVTERAVLTQLNLHIQANNLEDRHQSAYKSLHSTETDLLKVHSDLACHLDNNKAVILMHLDLSAAFDSIHHQWLIDRLHTSFGIEGTALKWFESYLSERT